MVVLHFEDLVPSVPILAHALTVTLELTVASIAGALLAAFTLAYIATGEHRALKLCVGAYVQVIRNTPVLIQMFLVFFGLPLVGLRLAPFAAGLVALIINNSAYITEILRGGIQAISRGQADAARITGLSRLQIYLLVLLPQALKSTWSSLTNQLVILFLNTSVCSYIALNELTATAMNVASDTYRMFEVYLLISALYIVVTFVLAGVFRLIERVRLGWEAL